jgi:hypothetical protein
MKTTDKKKQHYYFYSLHQLFGLHISRNKHVHQYIRKVLDAFVYDLSLMVWEACYILEENKYTYLYQDRQLYDHQKQLFTVVKSPNPKLILYTAPTGTGKTLSPLGLAQQYKIIFICAARHVGLAFARAAITMHKKIAFAFGCNDPCDVKLHYFSVKECVRDKKNGKIVKTTNVPFLVNFGGEGLKSINSITRILNKVFGKNIGVSMLRHSYLTSKYGKQSKEMEDDAMKMGHSSGQQKAYIKDTN